MRGTAIQTTSQLLLVWKLVTGNQYQVLRVSLPTTSRKQKGLYGSDRDSEKCCPELNVSLNAEELGK